MVDLRGDVLRPPHCTKPAAVKANKKMSSFKSNENIHKKEETGSVKPSLLFVYNVSKGSLGPMYENMCAAFYMFFGDCSV